MNNGYITVYLPSYCDTQLKKFLLPLKDFQFHVFSHSAKSKKTCENINFIPVNKDEFNRSLIGCLGIITGGGFETPAEALYLGKKIIAIPIKGQYEQECNAAALRRLGITTLDKLDDDFTDTFNNWIDKPSKQISYKYSTEEIVKFLMYNSTNLKYRKEEFYPEMIFN